MMKERQHFEFSSFSLGKLALTKIIGKENQDFTY